MANHEEMASNEPSAKVEEKKASVNNQVEAGVADFDWTAYAEASVYSSSELKNFEEMYDKTLSTIGDSEVVEGTVIAMNKREVVINIGFKSEGVISLNEFRYNPDLKIGDSVEVYVENQEDKKGQLVL